MKFKKLTAFFLTLLTLASLAVIPASAAGTYNFKLLSDKTLELKSYDGSAKLLSVPASANNYTVTSIGASAFADNVYLERIELPDTLKNIGANAFKGCTALKRIDIPASVTAIGSAAFEGCTSLTIYGAGGSFAQSYAAQNNLPFFDTSTLQKGDVNGDGKISLHDVLTIQLYINEKIELTPAQLEAADMNLDSKVNLRDCYLLQKQVSE